MPMRDQPEGVHRKPRGDSKPPSAYDIFVDGEYAGWVERLPKQCWRAYPEGGSWQRFDRKDGGYLSAAEMIAGTYRAARKTAEPVTVTEDASVQPLTGRMADPFAGDSFADPLG